MYDIHYEDWDKDIIMYGDQGVSTKEHDEAMYGELTKTESKEEEEVNYNTALCANNSMSLEKKSGTPNKDVYDVRQSDVSINENTTVNLFNDKGTTVRGPINHNNEIE